MEITSNSEIWDHSLSLPDGSYVYDVLLEDAEGNTVTKMYNQMVIVGDECESADGDDDGLDISIPGYPTLSLMILGGFTISLIIVKSKHY